jgi:hypothetical protein
VYPEDVKEKGLRNNAIQNEDALKYRNAWNPPFLDGFSPRQFRDFTLALCLCTILIDHYF